MIEFCHDPSKGACDVIHSEGLMKKGIKIYVGKGLDNTSSKYLLKLIFVLIVTDYRRRAESSPAE